MERPNYNVGCNSRDSQSKKSIISSFKDKLHFMLASPCTSKHLCVRHREACRKGSGWDLNISLSTPLRPHGTVHPVMCNLYKCFNGYEDPDLNQLDKLLNQCKLSQS
jgi:hypothetical protein